MTGFILTGATHGIFSTLAVKAMPVKKQYVGTHKQFIGSAENKYTFIKTCSGVLKSDKVLCETESQKSFFCKKVSLDLHVSADKIHNKVTFLATSKFSVNLQQPRIYGAINAIHENQTAYFLVAA